MSGASDPLPTHCYELLVQKSGDVHSHTRTGFLRPAVRSRVKARFLPASLLLSLPCPGTGPAWLPTSWAHCLPGPWGRGWGLL